MAKALELTIRIAGKMDKSLSAAINQSQKKISGFSKALSTIGTVGLATMGTLSVATVGALAKCNNEAVKYENELSNVIKYVNGLADANGRIDKAAIGLDGKLLEADNGKTYAENYDLVYDSIMRLSEQVPLTREYLADMVAGLGQSGKSIDEIFKFDKMGNLVGGLAKDAVVMAAAWDIDPKEASDYAAKWENAFHMNHEEVMTLANQINDLGANSATTAAEIANAVNQAASLGQLAGIAPSTTAALADAMLATGVASDRVGTSLKRMSLNLMKSSSMTEGQKAVLQELGFTSDQVAKGMISNSSAMLQSIFEGMQKLPDYRKLNAVGQLFGIWASEGGAKIVGNLDVYEEAFRRVNDSTLWGAIDENGNAQLTSIEREFDIKNVAPEAIKQMRENAFKNFQTDIGKAFVPLTKQIDYSLRDLFVGLSDKMPQLEEIAEKLATLASKGLDKLSQSLETALPYISQFLDYLNNHGDQALKIAGGMAATFAGMKFAPAIEGLMGFGADMFLGEPQMFGGRSGGLLSLITGYPDMMKTGLFGKKLKSGGTKGGLIPGIANMATGLFGDAKNFGGGILSALSGVGNTGFVQGIGGVTGEILSGIYGATIKDLVDGAPILGGMVLDGIKGSKPAQFIGNTFGAISGTAGKALSPLGVIGGRLREVGGGIMNFMGGTMAPFAGALGNLGMVIQNPFIGMLGSIFTGVGPIIAAISTVIALFSILGDHLGDIRNLIGNTFGDKGLAIFDAFIGKLNAVGDFINGLFEEGGVARALEPVKGFITNMFGDDAGAAFDGLTTILQSVMGVVQQIVTFSTTVVKPIIQDIFGYITGTVVPVLLETFTAAAPTIASIISNVGSIIMTVFTTAGQVIIALEPVFAAIGDVLLWLGSTVLSGVLESFNAWSATVLAVVQDVQGVFNGLIDFFTGVFTGNWQQAWEGIVEVAGSVMNGLIDVVKAPINAVIGLLNGFFSKVGSFEIPDWVPAEFGGGKRISFPHLSYLAKGGFTNGPSIAGEAGMEAVISFQRGQRGRNLAIWERAGQMLGARRAELRDIDTGNRGNGSGSIVFSPQIIIQGNADESVLDKAIQRMKEEFEQMMDERDKEKIRLAF